MRFSGASDASLVAAPHIERVNAGQVRKRGVRDTSLAAPAHIKRVNAA